MENNNHNIDNVVEKLDCTEFLNDGDFWSVDIAEKIAKKNKIAEYDLTDVHWKVINYVREYYEKYGKGPEMVKVAKNCGITSNEMCILFPCGLVRGAYKVAGLPRPAGCI